MSQQINLCLKVSQNTGVVTLADKIKEKKWNMFNLLVKIHTIDASEHILTDEQYEKYDKLLRYLEKDYEN